MKFIKSIVYAILISIIMLPFFARADISPQSPPLVIDDPGTPGPNNWEVNITFQSEISNEEKIYSIPLLDLNYGIGESLQLKYEVPWLLTNSEVEGRSLSMGNSKVGLKYNFFVDEINELSTAIYPQYEFVTRTTTLPILISKTADDVSVGFNFGYNFVESRPDEDSYFSAIGIGTSLSKSWSLMGDVWGNLLPKDNLRSARVDLGSIHEINEHTSIYFSIGHTLGKDIEGHSVFFATTGLRFAD